jgi:hypothetical protein
VTVTRQQSLKVQMFSLALKGGRSHMFPKHSGWDLATNKEKVPQGEITL